MFGSLGGYNPFSFPNDQKSSNYIDLVNYIDKNLLECLNADTRHPLDHALYEANSSYYLESDSDHQLVINLGFTCPIKLHHLLFRAPNDNSRPKIVKLFVNKKAMNFSECENENATQEFVLSDNDFKGETLTKFVKFQSVKTLTIFIEENEGGKKTKLTQLGLYGLNVLETDWDDANKCSISSQSSFADIMMILFGSRKIKWNLMAYSL